MRRFIKQVVEVLDGAPPSTKRGQRGQSLVEMTLIMPILLIILLGVIEIGWFAQNVLTLTESVRVGARRAPFLNGNFSPLAWNEEATYPPPSDALANDPRVRVRGGGAPDADCNEIEQNDNGFFNLIVCATISAMDPLVLNQANGKDDIVVSAFALQRVTIGATNNDDIDPNSSTFNSDTGYSAGTQLVVVGRYPYSANECYLWDERDPFDWIENGVVDHTLNPVQLPFELAVWDPVESQYVGFADTNDTEPERMVGFAWLGQWRYVNELGMRTDCYGSQWKMEEIQERANLEGFLTGEGDRQYLPSVGLVLVEVFWEHTLIFEDLPVISPVYEIMGGGQPDTVADVIRTWAMFPAPGAEPRLVFK